MARLGARERWDRTPGGLKINNRSFSGNFKKAPIPPSPAPIAEGGDIPDEPQAITRVLTAGWRQATVSQDNEPSTSCFQVYGVLK